MASKQGQATGVLLAEGFGRIECELVEVVDLLQAVVARLIGEQLEGPIDVVSSIHRVRVRMGRIVYLNVRLRDVESIIALLSR